MQNIKSRFLHLCILDSTVVVRARMRTEMEAEKRRLLEAEASVKEAQAGPKEVTLDGAPMMPQVLYCCPEIGPEVLPKEEMEGHIQAFLYNRFFCLFLDVLCVSETEASKEKAVVVFTSTCLVGVRKSPPPPPPPPPPHHPHFTIKKKKTFARNCLHEITTLMAVLSCR